MLSESSPISALTRLPSTCRLDRILRTEPIPDKPDDWAAYSNREKTAWRAARDLIKEKRTILEKDFRRKEKAREARRDKTWMARGDRPEGEGSSEEEGKMNPDEEEDEFEGSEEERPPKAGPSKSKKRQREVAPSDEEDQLASDQDEDVPFPKRQKEREKLRIGEEWVCDMCTMAVSFRSLPLILDARRLHRRTSSRRTPSMWTFAVPATRVEGRTPPSGGTTSRLCASATTARLRLSSEEGMPR